LVLEAREVAIVIHECVDEMIPIVANITFNLYQCRLKEVGQAEHLKVALMEDGIDYHGSVRDAGSSTSIPGQCTS